MLKNSGWLSDPGMKKSAQNPQKNSQIFLRQQIGSSSRFSLQTLSELSALDHSTPSFTPGMIHDDPWKYMFAWNPGIFCFPVRFDQDSVYFWSAGISILCITCWQTPTSQLSSSCSSSGSDFCRDFNEFVIGDVFIIFTFHFYSLDFSATLRRPSSHQRSKPSLVSFSTLAPISGNISKLGNYLHIYHV